MLLPYMPDFPLYELSTITFFLIPMLVILVVYIRMGLRIRNSVKVSLERAVQGAVHGDSKQIQSRRSVIRMLSKTLHIFPRNVSRENCNVMLIVRRCGGYFVFHLLGAVPRSAIALRSCARVRLLPGPERVAVHFKRMPLLLQHNRESHFI